MLFRSDSTHAAAIPPEAVVSPTAADALLSQGTSTATTSVDRDLSTSQTQPDSTNKKASHDFSETKKNLGSLWEGFKVALHTAEPFVESYAPVKWTVKGLLTLIDIFEVCPTEEREDVDANTYLEISIE